MKEESDSDTKVDTEGRCQSAEANSVDRYISKLHCNLDSRYQVPGLLAMEMRKPQNFAHHKGLLQSWKRSTTFGAGINLQTDKQDAHESIDANELPPRCWPNPLTSKHQAAMAQRFCSHFFQRYCNQSGDFPQQSLLTQGHSLQADGGHSDSCDEQQSIGTKVSNSRPKRTLCPMFFTGSLADAFKLSERPPGRPWPVTLLYLHHDDSVHTHRFVQDILCSHEEDTCSAPVSDSASNSQMPDPSAVTSEHYELREPLITHNIASDPEVDFPLSTSTSLTTPICPTQHCEQTGQSMPIPCRIGKRKQLAGGKLKAASKDNGNQTPSKRHERARSFGPRITTQNTNMSGNKGISTAMRPKSVRLTNRICDTTMNLSNTAQFFSPPDQHQKTITDETDSTTIRLRLTTAQSDGGLEYPIDGHVEDARTYSKLCRNKSFRSLLVERSAGLVPWDCSTSGMRKYLRSAFDGTCLAQWIDEWIRPNQYPVLVAVGRTVNRRVVCSRLHGANATRTGAIRWLNEVTLAHFYDYTHTAKSTCSEKSAKQSRASSVCPSISAKDVHAQAANSPKCTPQNRSRITITKSRTTAVTGELTEHKFLSNLGAFSAIGGKESTVICSSRASAEGTQYQVAVTPQQDSGPLSILFEAYAEPPIKQDNLQLKRVHLSFKNAISSLERATAPICLRQLDIPVPTVMNDLDAQDPNKPVPSSVLVATLCTVPRTSRKEARYLRYRDNPVVTQTRGGGTVELNKMKRKTTQQPQVEHTEYTYQDDRGCPWFSKTEALDLKSAGLRTSFYEWFKQYLVLPFPSTPPFLLGRFQTALLRTIDILHCQQTSPLLVYLHDNEAPGVIHFIANILCSRRFTSKLFDHGLHIWPLDVTGVADHEQRRTGGLHRTQSTIGRTSSENESRLNQGAVAPEGVGKLKTKHRFRALGFASSRYGKHSKQEQIQTQASPLYQENKCKPPLENTAHSSPPVGSADEIPSQIERCAAARELMEYFDGQPANQTFLRLFKIPVLPTLVNIMYSDKCFSITHVLLPSSTTKEAIVWLNVLLKYYNKLRLRNSKLT